MSLHETLALPLFDDGHRRFAETLSRWADATLPTLPHDDVDEACRARVKALGEAGLLKAVVPQAHGGLHPVLDVRTLCIAREILAFRDGLADFAFAMQGLGTASISLFGSEELKRKYLPPVRDGKAIAAFALSEPEAGSTAKKPGYRTAESPTITLSSRGAARRRAPAGCRPSSSMPRHRGSPSPSASR